MALFRRFATVSGFTGLSRILGFIRDILIADVVGTGRDHNQYGFSVWLAGGGVRGGYAYGSTDEVGWRAVEQRMSWHDFHATVLHLLGIDHQRLTFYHNGIERRLTNVHGHVLKDLIA